jgi:AraC-like DNA-binding protein
MAATTLLGSWPGLRVLDLECGAARSGPSALRGGEVTHLAVLRRGVFAYHLGARSSLGEPGTALLHRGRHDYRVSHPAEGGDACTSFELDDDLCERLFGPEGLVELRVAPQVRLGLSRLRAALLCGAADLEDEARALLSALAGERAALAPSASERRLARRARERIHARLDENVSARELAADLGLSPFTLMRAFRRATGRTLRRYRLELRLATALGRLEQGERDLARLAADLGFAHHSHLSASFTNRYGAPPTALIDAPGRRARF